MLQNGATLTVAAEIDGISYFAAIEVCKALGVSRQTLWRWRQEGRIPAGHRFRNGQVFFTEAELDAVRDYANRIEPIGSGDPGQLKLFNGIEGAP